MIPAGHGIEHKPIEMINKFYHYYLLKRKTSWQFKFILKKDVDFKYKIIVDIIYLDEKPILHAVDAAIAF